MSRLTRKIDDLQEYDQLFDMLRTAHDTLITASTQGAHYLLISLLKTNHNVSTNGREDAMSVARKMLNEFDFEQVGYNAEMEKYAEMADAL